MSDVEKEKEGLLQKALVAAQKADEQQSIRNTMTLIDYLLDGIAKTTVYGIEEATKVVAAHGWLSALKKDLESKLEASNGN